MIQINLHILQYSQVVGGTNMTFFNTLANLGNMWPDTFFLWFVDVITYKVRYFIKMIGKIMINTISNIIMKKVENDY